MPSDLQLEFSFSKGDLPHAKAFLNFLRTAARKHSLKISFHATENGQLIVSIPREHWQKAESFLQELVFSKGLYYYLCSVSNRRRIAKSVVKPIAEELLASCFSVVYPVLIHKHLLQGSPDWTAGEFSSEGYAQEYELLFHRLKLKMVSNYEFVRDLDDLLTQFMLFQLGHRKGDQSPKFNALVDQCGKQNILRDRAVCKLFNKVHALRTRGLHRSEREIPDAEITDIEHSIYNVFQWLEDYWTAQREKTVMLAGRRYRRVRFGRELAHLKRSPLLRQQIDKEFEMNWREVIQRPCHDCSVIQGELHLDGCDVEVCPRCGGQYLGCECHFATED
jgi:hypothetical protein